MDFSGDTSLSLNMLPLAGLIDLLSNDSFSCSSILALLNITLEGDFHPKQIRF